MLKKEPSHLSSHRSDDMWLDKLQMHQLAEARILAAWNRAVEAILEIPLAIVEVNEVHR